MPRKFGIELEVCGQNKSMGQVARLITEAGVSCNVESYNHARRSSWKIVSDGSLMGSNMMEIVSPPLRGKKGLAQVQVVADTLAANGVTVNRTCGLHVHVEARDLTVEHLKNVARLAVIHESHLKSVLPPSRRDSRWATWPSALRIADTVDSRCEAISRCATTQSLMNLWGNDRYRAVNFESLSRHTTIEFRAHSGTVDAKKILAWVSLCIGIIRRAETDEVITPVWGCGKPRCFQDVVRMAGKRHEKYFFDRRQQFAMAA